MFYTLINDSFTFRILNLILEYFRSLEMDKNITSKHKIFFILESFNTSI